MAPKFVLPACFHLAQDVFPRVRAEAARQLVAQGNSQTDAANLLGVSQAMVSKYQSGAAETDPLVARLVAELVQPVAGANGGSWCALLASQDLELPTKFFEAEALVLAELHPELVPAVGTNLALRADGATQPNDVLAYPVRIQRSGHKLVRALPPEFGASSHLGAMLVAHPTARFALNVRAVSDLIGQTTLAAQPLHRGASVEDATTLAAPLLAQGADAVLDEGGHGIEPALYLFATDIAQLRAAIHTLSRMIHDS